MDYLEISLTILISTGISSSILLALMKIFGQGILEKLNRDWKEKQEQEITELRSKLKKDEDKFSNLLSIYQNNSTEYHNKRVDAGLKLWDLKLEFQNYTQYLLFYGILLDSEIKDVQNKKNFMDKLNELFNQNSYLDNIENLLKKESKLRLLITDEVWLIYNVYRGFIIRALFSVFSSIRENKPILNWKEDDGTKKMLESIISEEDIKTIYSLKIRSFDVVLTYLELRLIDELIKMFLGEFEIKSQKSILERSISEINSQPSSLKDYLNKPEFQSIFFK